MSLVTVALLAASGAILGGWLARVRPPRLEPDGSSPEKKEEGEDTSNPAAQREDAEKKLPRTKDPFAGFPCRLGDVILALDGEEAWLESALVFYEDAPVLVLFLAPNAGVDRAVLVRRSSRDVAIKPDKLHQGDILWLTAAAPLTWGPSEEPPSTLLHGGDQYERVRRLPLEADAMGPSAPKIAGNLLLVEYKSAADDRLLVLLGGATVLTWEGRPLGSGMYEVLPGEGALGGGA